MQITFLKLIIINFTNNDLVNAALIQISFISVRLDTSKWIAYRDALIPFYQQLGIDP